IRPNRSTAAVQAASASSGLVMSSLTTSSSSASPTALATASVLRPVATTAFPAASAALAMSTPMPRPAPVMNQTSCQSCVPRPFLFMRSIRNREGPRLDYLFCQARLAFASVVAYSRVNSTLLLFQGAESIGAYAWRFVTGNLYSPDCRQGFFSETRIQPNEWLCVRTGADHGLPSSTQGKDDRRVQMPKVVLLYRSNLPCSVKP